VIVFYHNDLDGCCSAFWAKNYYINNNIEDEIEFKVCNYGEKDFSVDMVKENEKVWIVDYHIEPDEMEKLFYKTNNVVWIDHHQTAIDKYKDYKREIKGIRKDGIAACMLTYYYSNKVDESEWNNYLTPYFTKLIGDWDVWKFDYGDTTKYFQLGCMMEDIHPSSDLWLKLFDNNKVEKIIENGKISIRYKDEFMTKLLKSFGFEVEFEGYKCIVLNVGLGNSECFKSVY